MKIPLVLAPYEAKVIVVGPLPKEAAAAAEPSFAAGTTLAELTGEWSLTLKDKPMTTELKSWEELGTTGFAGPATYHKQFTADAAPKGKRVYLEIADVHDYAKVTLNGKELGAAGWQPYRWDVTGALKKGANDLVIEVDALATGRGGGFGAPPPAARHRRHSAPGLATAPPAGAGAAAGARRRPTARRALLPVRRLLQPAQAAVPLLQRACNLRPARQRQAGGVLTLTLSSQAGFNRLFRPNMYLRAAVRSRAA